MEPGFVESKPARRGLLALLLIDLLLIAVHVLAEIWTTEPADSVYMLQTDRGIAEVFGYLQLTLLVWTLWRTFLRHRQPVYAAWMSIFLVVLLDDSLRLHEVSGARLAEVAPSLPGLRPRDTGELAFWAAAGLILGALLLLSVYRSEARYVQEAMRLLAPFAVLVLFAVGIDMLSIVAWDSFPGSINLLPVVEDGGELITITWALAVANGVKIFDRSAREPTYASVADGSEAAQ